MKYLSLITAVICASALNAPAAILGPGLAPLATFGGGDGHLAPGDRTYLTTDNTQRGMSYNPQTGHLLLVSRAGGGLGLHVLDGVTGADAGLLNVSGISGGTFPLNMIAIADDGAIYAANLALTASQQFKIYRWENESSAPTLDYNNQPGTNSPRLGDTLDVRGTSFTTELAVGIAQGSSNRGYMIFSTSGGAPYTVFPQNFASSPPEPGDHHLGITFLDGNKVMGTRGGLVNFTDLSPAHISTYSTTGPELIASPVLTSQGERPMDFAIIGGKPILATVDTFSSLVRVYDITNEDRPVLLDSLTTISGPSNPNGNGVGQVRFGAIVGGTATFYALNTNNGIQAFTFVVPEPSGVVMLAVAGLALSRRRR